MNAAIATPAAPSAAPAAAPAGPAAAPAAPSAPVSLEDYTRLAAKSLREGPPASAPAAIAPAAPNTPTEPAATPGSGSPPGTDANPTTEPTDPLKAGRSATDPTAPVQTPEPADEAEPTTEEQATWTEGERRLHAALVKERQNRKDARKELGTMRQELDELKGKLTPAAAPAATPQTPPAPTPAAVQPTVENVLADCITFEAVDARATQAATTEAMVMRMQTTLARSGLEAAQAQLKGMGLEKVGGVPVAEASAEQIGDFLASAYEGARLVQVQAEPRKRYLSNQAAHWQQATKDVPEILDPKSARHQLFKEIVTAAPWLKNIGPHWPQLVVTQLLGMEARNGKMPPNKAAATPPAAPNPNPTPPARTLPGTPRTSAAATPSKSEVDELRAKVNNGTATLPEVGRLATLSLRQG